ncbi:hypothetical protein [Psychrobacter sp. PAMC 21119]|uniref:hypothetical protein n=1 Tax=Psychrobacter sp. PAMC 21119 TaxID=1112209 RepID=UPI000289D0A6|nr:hypothetical protein [Psychrobacter sp. PAMC 21119]
MTYFLFSFVFMLMYGSCVAVLAYKTGKCERDKLIKGVNKRGDRLYFYRSTINYILLDHKVKDVALIDLAGEKWHAPIHSNLWIKDFTGKMDEVSK